MKTVIFDFDGTLVDTLEEVIRIYNEISDSYGVDRVDEKQINHLKHKTASELFEYLHIPLAKVPLIAAKIKALLKEKIKDMKLVSGIRDVLLRLRDQNYLLGIISSNRTDIIKIFLNINKIDFIDFIYTGKNIFGKHLVIGKFISKFNLKKDDVTYVGDEVRDIDACRKLGIKIISVCWGYNSKEALMKLNGQFIAEKANDVTKYL